MRATVDDGETVPRMKCTDPDCDGLVEANMGLYVNVYADGSFLVEGVADDAASIQCNVCCKDHHTLALGKAMSAWLEEILPGTTWQGSDPHLGDK